MKVAIVFNRESKRVINLFGVPNQEKYGLAAIKRITAALKDGGHQVIAVEGDKDLIDTLEDFMPRVIKGERPGLVFNLSYGIQGQARYTHVPGILEMVGVPYVGSGPLAHSLALDKGVAKILFQQQGLPTPKWAVLETEDFESPELPYPLIVKPKGEGAVSMGIEIVNDEAELRTAAKTILGEMHQTVLVEQFIDGREINVGLLGNGGALEAFAPAELVFRAGPKIYTTADKKAKDERRIDVVCPADLDPELTAEAQEVARQAFRCLGCNDCARVDLRLDDDGNLFILEINTLPSLGEHGSYVNGAAQAGLDFSGLVNRLVEVASARYFGTPKPRQMKSGGTDTSDQVLEFVTERRDKLERRLLDWVTLASRTNDPVGIQNAIRTFEGRMHDVGLRRAKELTDDRTVWGWETERGLDGGTLIVAHVDVPMQMDAPGHGFRRDPEWIYGEGVGCSRAPLTMLEFALRGVRQRRLRKLPLGVLCYTDEGRDCHYSEPLIRTAMRRASQVLVLRPATSDGKLVTQRRGQRKYRLVAEGKPARAGQSGKHTEVLRWTAGRIEQLASLSSRKQRIAVSTTDLRTEAFPMLLPHKVTATVLLTYPDRSTADDLETSIRETLGKTSGLRWSLDLMSDRPPLQRRSGGTELARRFAEIAARSEIELEDESSVWPSVAGLAPDDVPVVCGVGPVTHDLYRPQEAVHRLSLVQRTLVLAQLLAEGAG